MPDLRRLFSWWPLRPTVPVQIHPDLLAAVEAIAAQDNLPVSVVVNDFLRFALAERRASQHTLATWQTLTDREKEVTVLIWLGLTNPEIAARLVISENTVKTHIRHILSKFDMHSKEALRQTLSTLDFSEWVHMRRLPPAAPSSGVSPDQATP